MARVPVAQDILRHPPDSCSGPRRASLNRAAESGPEGLPTVARAGTSSGKLGSACARTEPPDVYNRRVNVCTLQVIAPAHVSLLSFRARL
jgi:hypothetical protein